MCHKEVKGSNLWKLRIHLLQQGKGRQGKCQAVNSYITERLQQILADEGFNPDGTLNRNEAIAVNPEPPLPPPPDHNDAGGPTIAENVEPPLPPPPDHDDAGGPPLPPDGGDAS